MHLSNQPADPRLFSLHPAQPASATKRRPEPAAAPRVPLAQPAMVTETAEEPERWDGLS